MRRIALAAVLAAGFAACSDGHGHDQKLREKTQSFCTTLQSALERARDGVVSGQERVAPYGDIRGSLLAWNAELTLCATVRAGDTTTLLQRFGVADDAADALLAHPISELDPGARAKLRDQLGEMASIAKTVAEMPFE